MRTKRQRAKDKRRRHKKKRQREQHRKKLAMDSVARLLGNEHDTWEAYDAADKVIRR